MAEKTLKMPRIIHQSYISEETVPDHWKSSYKATREICEDNGWTYMFHSDEDNLKLVEEHYPDMLELYNAQPKPIMRADMARSCYLHKYGGLYLDLDLQLKPEKAGALFELFDGSEVAISRVCEGNGMANQNWTNAFMMSMPGSRFWEIVQELYAEPWKHRKWKKFLIKTFDYYRVIMGTGPGTISDAVSMYEEEGGVVANIPEQLAQPGYFGAPLPYTSEEAVLTKLRGSSWHEDDASAWSWFSGARRHWGIISSVCMFLFLSVAITFIVLFAKR